MWCEKNRTPPGLGEGSLPDIVATAALGRMHLRAHLRLFWLLRRRNRWRCLDFEVVDDTLHARHLERDIARLMPGSVVFDGAAQHDQPMLAEHTDIAQTLRGERLAYLPLQQL